MPPSNPLDEVRRLLEKACLAIASLGSEVTRCGDALVELGQAIRILQAEAREEQAQLEGSARSIPRYREH